MKKYLLPILLLLNFFTSAQDGTIVSKQPHVLHDSVFRFLQARDRQLAQRIRDSVNFFRITYLSDGLKVIAYMAEPKAEGKYPCIISNRGGNRDFGQWNPLSIAYTLGQMASWQYVVIASQYRGNDGGEGKEEFGGRDVNDVMNLLPVLQHMPKADTVRIGIDGTSRGGMMTYLALKRSCRFKAAVVTAGLADALLNLKSRPAMGTGVYAELIPGYDTDQESVLKQRSVVYWADQLCKTTPLLLMHGSSDWRVLPEESLQLVPLLYKAKHPLRFILFEGADHGISEFRSERYAYIKNHFDMYLRDGKKWPSLEPHGL